MRPVGNPWQGSEIRKRRSQESLFLSFSYLWLFCVYFPVPVLVFSFSLQMDFFCSFIHVFNMVTIKPSYSPVTVEVACTDL